MNNKILAEMEFASIISNAYAQTQTGAELLNKYKAHLMANESTCTLVNNFIRESQPHRYDNGVNEALEMVADYISQNKTSWALASACESINNNGSSYNYLNRNAAKQVEKLLEMDESEIVKYIKAGALKNVMYCESFRNIAKQVFKEQPLVEATAEYTKVTPISMVESVGDGVCFEVNGKVYKMGDDKSIQESSWNEVSNTFKTISQLLESNLVTVENGIITVKAGNAEYTINEAHKVVRTGKEGSAEMTVDQLRENNRVVLMTTNPRYRNEMASVLEAIALTCENYDHILNMDNVAIYTTKNDKFVVIEAGSNIYATLLASNHMPAWTVNESGIEALSFIKKKTNTTLSENYKDVIEANLQEADAQEKTKLAEELKEQEKVSYKERIEALTEKFKNDPVKLAVLSKIAQELSEVEE
jgi:hypothetical protein